MNEARTEFLTQRFVSEEFFCFWSVSSNVLEQLIYTQLTGKALKVFAELTVSQCQDYEVLKKALLLAYARVP